MKKLLRAGVAVFLAALIAATSAAPAAAATSAPLAPAGAAQAAAHPSSFYYVAGKWPAGQSVSYGLHAGFPGDSNWSGRVYDAKQGWNNVAGASEPKFYWVLADYQFYGYYNQPCTLLSGYYSAIVFHQVLDSLGSNVIGYSQSCNSGGTRIAQTVAFDSSGTFWYIGTGATTSGWMDLWSAAAHEWGHATGFQNHLADGEAGVCPAWENVVRNTMCPAVFPGLYPMRDPNTHDIHTFTAAY